jgi:hypothetical protein
MRVEVWVASPEPAVGVFPTHIDNPEMSAQPTTSDGRPWTTCPLLPSDGRRTDELGLHQVEFFASQQTLFQHADQLGQLLDR